MGSRSGGYLASPTTRLWRLLSPVSAEHFSHAEGVVLSLCVLKDLFLVAQHVSSMGMLSMCVVGGMCFYLTWDGIVLGLKVRIPQTVPSLEKRFA